MAEPVHVRLVEGGRLVFEGPLAGPVELGRQQTEQEELYAWLPGPGAGPARLVVARHDEKDNISRHHALLEPLPSGGVRVTNRSKAPLACPPAPGCALPPGAAAELPPPFSLALPGRVILVEAADSGDELGLHSLEELTLGPGRAAGLTGPLRSLPALSAAQLHEMVGWLQTTMSVLQAAVGGADFLDKAAAALVEIVGLDMGRVLLLDGQRWEAAAAHGAAPEGRAAWQPSRHVLAQVREKKKAVWQLPREAGPAEAPSLGPLQLAVAAPLLDGDGRVIGALYGERRAGPRPAAGAGGKVEAVLVDLLACGVATGLARQAQEMAALQSYVRFEQFFGPDLARRLAREPDLLAGRDAEVTVLFGDVRGFSRFSERIGPAQTVRWMNDVLGELSESVLGERGALVDYLGDELMAMWGAPEDQPDQAARAVRAALAMLAALPALSARWQAVLGQPLAVTVGVNTGPAQVGNVGSRFKFKYGPIGTAVNLAHRVQGLTRHLKCPLLVTRATRRRLGDEFAARRVVRTRVVNIEEPVDLYEVATDAAARRQFFAESEAALDALEAGDFAFAVSRAGALLLEQRGDGPLLLILSRASAALVQDGRGFHPVWEPPGK